MIPVALVACLAVSAASDRILAGYLAAQSEAFAALDPGAVIGWAPAPGIRRVFSTAELRRVGARLGSPELPEQALCVERKLAPPDPARILAAIRSQVPEAVVTLIDYSRTLAPEGELLFLRNGLRRAPGGAYFWNGSVRYAAGRRFSIWAKIEVRSTLPSVVAGVDLKPGRAIEPGQVRLGPDGDLSAPEVLNATEEAIGKWPRRPIRVGTPIVRQWLEPAPEVSRGETVEVDVWSGAAHLQLAARAEGSAAMGERVPLRNPATQKRFYARVEGKNRVSVGRSGLSGEPAPKEKP
jgi:flagella basal body P-ring formation protein FlgA